MREAGRAGATTRVRVELKAHGLYLPAPPPGAAKGEVPNEQPHRIKPLPTVLVGAAGGLIVGMTSVGSGSLMIVLLMLLYPRLSARTMVGTDLVQAVPLVAAAALGHVVFGDFKLGLTDPEKGALVEYLKSL